MTEIIFRIFVLTGLIQSATAAATRENQEIFSVSWADQEDKIPYLHVDENLIPEINETCKNDGVCDNVNNYPVNLAAWVLRQLVNKHMTEFTMEKQLISNIDSSLSLCNSTEKTYFPKAAYSTQSKTWKFILNLDEDVARFQGFYVNICDNHESCRGLATLWTTRCDQTYTEKKMVYLDLKKKETMVDTFKVPICCSCKVI